MGVEWIILGGIGAAANAIDNFKSNERLARYEGHANYLMLDPEIEDQLWRDVKNPKKHDEIWDRIERFKIRNPNIVALDRTNYWDIVGKRRLSCKTYEEQRKTIWLLAMTYGRPCKEEAQSISLQRTSGYGGYNISYLK